MSACRRPSLTSFLSKVAERDLPAIGTTKRVPLWPWQAWCPHEATHKEKFGKSPRHGQFPTMRLSCKYVTQNNDVSAKRVSNERVWLLVRLPSPTPEECSIGKGEDAPPQFGCRRRYWRVFQGPESPSILPRRALPNQRDDTRCIISNLVGVAHIRPDPSDSLPFRCRF